VQICATAPEKIMYKKVIKPILFRFNPEPVHDFFISFGEFLGGFTLGRNLVSLFYNYRGPDISKTVDGIKYRTPILLSAGFDYNGRLSRILSALSFGGEEVGSVTARPCAGNDRPRLTRLPRSKSIIVNKGLKNDGVEKIIARLKNRPRAENFVIGISLARTNDASSATLPESIADYAFSLRRLTEEGVGDYYTINISCPNAYSGEIFTDPDSLEGLFQVLDKISRANPKKPLYVKMPTSVSDQTFKELLAVLARHKVEGVVIGNLMKDYRKINVHDASPEKFQGGLSGAPCFDRSNELIALTKKEYKNRFTIIGSGGIFSPADAKKKMELGADLVQLITGMIYEGPGLINAICRSLAVAPRR